MGILAVLAAHHVEVEALELGGDRPDTSLAHRAPVDLGDRRDVRGGAGHEALVGHVELAAVDGPLDGLDTQLVTAPPGSSVVVDWKKNGATVATVTVAAAATYAETVAAVALAVDDLLWPEISAVGNVTPGTPAMMRARQS